MKLYPEPGRSSCKYKLISLIIFFVLCFTAPLFALPVNAPAPNFTLANLEGKKISLSDYQGKTVILKLGTTWCPGCRDQDNELQKLSDFLQGGGIVIIQVFLDDSAEEIKHYQQEYVMKSPVVTLLGDERLLRDYAVYAIPRLIILSKEQQVLSDATGMTAAQIKARILQK